MQKNYKFTQNWFTMGDWEQFLKVNPTDELHILEIGSFEGRSTTWFIDNVLKNQKSTITCIDSWMNFYQNTNSANTYDIDTKTKTGIDFVRDNIKSRFLHNILQTGQVNKVKTIHGYSQDELPKLISQSERYDIVFIDGNHTSPFVLSDAIMSWHLLKKNGLMIFDDYEWNNFGEGTPTTCPKLAVDSFVECFKDYIEIIWVGYRYVIKKIK